ncbi:hypothetical protein KSS87_006275 [Heliosperma pusillum]|nr:hypothetical protein KSS87_006275 [Heliosperma pusillum]
MEGISLREEVLLGYNTITLSNSQRRKSEDVDFSDVFGGPPRRSSTQSRDSYSNGDNNDGEDEGSSSSWMKLREKPVFGEATTVVRRRYTSDDFFDDIFRGDQPSSSCSQSPRVSYLSAPGSRVMSPSRSLPPAPLFGSPSKFSLPTRVTNAEFTASTSTNQSSFNPPMSRFNQTMQNQNHGSVFPRHTSSESVNDSQLDGSLDQFSPHSNAKASDFPIYATNFHFSIYKWGSKSVPLVVSLRKKSALSKATNLEQCPSESKKGVDADILLSEKHDVYVSNTVRPSSPVKEYEHRNENVTAPAAESNPTFVISPSDAVDRAREEVSSYGLENARESRNVTSKGSDFRVHKSNDPPELPTQRNSDLRPLSSFLNADSTGNERINAKNTGDKISRVEEKEKASSVEDVSSRSKVNKSTVRKASQARRKDVSNNNEAVGKVKDFVKIFNQESPSRATSHGLHKSHSKKWKDAKTVETDQEIKSSSTKTEENEATHVNWGEELTDTVEMEDGFSSETQQFTVNDIGCEPQNVEQPSSNEAIKAYETKVLQWSKGKEGNIRALLSTLQYVLWADSGWKPVPLVDIIEANAVKRAYQKALLRLHPDKLQQKGAASHHKLIAEKVFDILQVTLS